MPTVLTKRIPSSPDETCTKRVSYGGVVSGQKYEPWRNSWLNSWGNTWCFTSQRVDARPVEWCSKRIAGAVTISETARVADGVQPPNGWKGTIATGDFTTAQLDDIKVLEEFRADDFLTYAVLDGALRITQAFQILGGYIIYCIPYDIPADLQGSVADLNFSFDIGDFSDESNSWYKWVAVDAVAAETIIVDETSWAGPENSYQTFSDNGLTLPSDAVTIQLQIRYAASGIGIQGGDLRVDNVSIELV